MRASRGAFGAPAEDACPPAAARFSCGHGRSSAADRRGGIGSGAEAYERIRAGASLVQLYTALVYEGPGLARRITRELKRLLQRDGFAKIAEAIGTDA
jgi:dihydroorotate dehydrogenase